MLHWYVCTFLFMLVCWVFPVKKVSAQVVDIRVDAGQIAGELAPIWGDHYDLSVIHSLTNYPADLAFQQQVSGINPRYWRCSVGRWEVGFTAPAGGIDPDTAVLRQMEREFYRGANNLNAADDPANYHFAYLDSQLNAILKTGAIPLPCFDYMPFTLSSIKDPGNAFNYSANPTYTFSNGIRTSPPADPAVYARVVRNTIRHTKGLFAGTKDYGITYVEIGNEPDLPPAPELIFWTGTSLDFYNMYAAIAQEIDGDTDLNQAIQLGGGSFAFFLQQTVFTADFLALVAANSTRLDFLSYHSYHDDPGGHFAAMQAIHGLRNTFAPQAILVNGEWGRVLDGPDPVYDRIEHGLLKAKTMILMQLFGIKIANEALLIDPPGDNNLGLFSSGPIAGKPVTDVYKGLNKLNNCLNALPITTTPPDNEYTIAGMDNANERICVIYIGDDPGIGQTKTVQMQVSNLPWSSYYAYRYEVSEESWSGQQGVWLKKTDTLTGNTFNETVSYGPGPGNGQLLIWELSSKPVTANTSFKPKPGWKIIPQKEQHRLMVTWKNLNTSTSTVSLLNTAGQQLLTQQLNGTSGSYPIDISGIAPGTYVVVVQSGHERDAQKIVLH